MRPLFLPIAQVSGEVDQVFRDVTRRDAIAAATTLAVEQAVAAGADASTLKTIETEDVPLSYLPGNRLRVRVRMVGDVSGSPPGRRRADRTRPSTRRVPGRAR